MGEAFNRNEFIGEARQKTEQLDQTIKTLRLAEDQKEIEALKQQANQLISEVEERAAFAFDNGIITQEQLEYIETELDYAKTIAAGGFIETFSYKIPEQELEAYEKHYFDRKEAFTTQLDENLPKLANKNSDFIDQELQLIIENQIPQILKEVNDSMKDDKEIESKGQFLSRIREDLLTLLYRGIEAYLPEKSTKWKREIENQIAPHRSGPAKEQVVDPLLMFPDELKQVDFDPSSLEPDNVFKEHITIDNVVMDVEFSEELQDILSEVNGGENPTVWQQMVVDILLLEAIEPTLKKLNSSSLIPDKVAKETVNLLLGKAQEVVDLLKDPITSKENIQSIKNDVEEALTDLGPYLGKIGVTLDLSGLETVQVILDSLTEEGLESLNEILQRDPKHIARERSTMKPEEYVQLQRLAFVSLHLAKQYKDNPRALIGLRLTANLLTRIKDDKELNLVLSNFQELLNELLFNEDILGLDLSDEAKELLFQIIGSKEIDRPTYQSTDQEFLEKTLPSEVKELRGFLKNLLLDKLPIKDIIEANPAQGALLAYLLDNYTLRIANKYNNNSIEFFEMEKAFAMPPVDITLKNLGPELIILHELMAEFSEKIDDPAIKEKVAPKLPGLKEIASLDPEERYTIGEFEAEIEGKLKI